MSVDNVYNFKRLLTEHGYRNTAAREATFNLLLNSEPQTMQEILNKSKGSVDRVSVYRNIELFEKLGIAHRVYVGWKYKVELSEDFIAHHHHLSCIKCRQIIEIEDEHDIDEFIHELAKKFNFSPRRHQFEIDGYCSDCTSQSISNVEAP